MAERKKQASGWFARWRERRREAARRAGDIEARTREARRAGFGRPDGRGAGDGQGGPAGGM
jgi:hypothetical protein